MTNDEVIRVNDLMNQQLPENIEKIVAIDFIKNSTKVALAKVDNLFRLFIEIVDLITSSKEIVNLEKDIFLNYSSLYYYDEFTLSSIFNSNIKYRYPADLKEFTCLSNNVFYLKISLYNENLYEDWHLQIDNKGKVVNEQIDNLDRKYKFYSDRNSVFFDINKFEEINMKDFFNDFFEEDQFDYYIYAMGDTFSANLLADERKLGLWYFFKDEEIPRGNFSIFDIKDAYNPQLIFSFKLDEYGDFKFSFDKKKVIYWHYENNQGTLRSYHVREVNANSFDQKQEIFIEYDKNNSHVIDFALINETLLEVFLDKFKLHDVLTKKSYKVPRDISSPYCFNSKTLVYLHNYKLKKINFN